MKELKIILLTFIRNLTFWMEKLNNYHIKFDEINDMIDLIISNEYNKIYKTYYPIKNYDLSQDRFFIYSENIDIPLKANTYIIFEYIFDS